MFFYRTYVQFIVKFSFLNNSTKNFVHQQVFSYKLTEYEVSIFLNYLNLNFSTHSLNSKKNVFASCLILSFSSNNNIATSAILPLGFTNPFTIKSEIIFKVFRLIISSESDIFENTIYVHGSITLGCRTYMGLDSRLFFRGGGGIIRKASDFPQVVFLE